MKIEEKQWERDNLRCQRLFFLPDLLGLCSWDTKSISSGSYECLRWDEEGNKHFTKMISRINIIRLTYSILKTQKFTVTIRDNFFFLFVCFFLCCREAIRERERESPLLSLNLEFMSSYLSLSMPDTDSIRATKNTCLHEKEIRFSFCNHTEHQNIL